MIRRMKKKMMIVVAASASVLGLGACSSTDAEATASCPASKPIENPDFAAAVQAVQLPDGATVTAGRYTPIGSDTGMFGAAIDICDPSVTSADDLRETATAYAKALKASPIAEQIDAVWVSSYQVDGETVVNEVKLKDPDFQMRLWNGMPSVEAEQKNWDVLVG
ncbi:hypothetical protein A5N71_01150 [Prescottella equi]|nr:hypothetical protein A5N71_01150 [Prescottella equi]